MSVASIKVVGVGGSGCNAVSRMMTCKIQGVDLIAVNTDIQDLKKANSHQKLQIGRGLTKGLGTGMNPEIGRRAVEEQKEEVAALLKGSDMVFVACGLGGGTGSGAAPAIAEIAKRLGALVIAVVTKPFSFEGDFRKRVAQKALLDLRGKVDTLLSIPNDRLLKMIDRQTSVFSAFWLCDETLRQAVQGISDLIVLPGLVNVDFADIKTVMKNSGPALLGIGRAKGERRAAEAALRALNSPLLDSPIEGGRAVLFNASGAKNMTLSEIEEIAKTISQRLHPQARVIFGAVEDNKLDKGEIKVTLIATGF